MIAGSQTIADDRRRSQKIEHGSIFCERSSAITIAGSQAIAEVCFHMIADDRRTFCDLRSAIVCDHMETSLNNVRAFYPHIIPVLSYVYIKTLLVIEPMRLLAISKHFKCGIVRCFVYLISKDFHYFEIFNVFCFYPLKIDVLKGFQG